MILPCLIRRRFPIFLPPCFCLNPLSPTFRRASSLPFYGHPHDSPTTLLPSFASVKSVFIGVNPW